MSILLPWWGQVGCQRDVFLSGSRELRESHIFNLKMKPFHTFGEHERGVRVARGAAECNSSVLSALQTSQVLNISTYAQLQHEIIVLQHYQSDQCSS